jgi:hypothetical protein
MADDQQLLTAARSTLRAWTGGMLRFDEHVRQLKYVIAPDGRLVAPAMVAMLSTLDTALHIPEEDEDGLQLLVELHEFDAEGAEGALADRWRIYHGAPDDMLWAVMDIDLARFHGGTLDGEAMVLPNALAPYEAALCKLVNDGHREALAAALQGKLNITASDPLLVGVDPTGIDVRADRGVVRLQLELGEDSQQASGVLLGALGVV